MPYLGDVLRSKGIDIDNIESVDFLKKIVAQKGAEMTPGSLQIGEGAKLGAISGIVINDSLQTGRRYMILQQRLDSTGSYTPFFYDVAAEEIVTYNPLFDEVIPSGTVTPAFTATKTQIVNSITIRTSGTITNARIRAFVVGGNDFWFYPNKYLWDKGEGVTLDGAGEHTIQLADPAYDSEQITLVDGSQIRYELFYTNTTGDILGHSGFPYLKQGRQIVELIDFPEYTSTGLTQNAIYTDNLDGSVTVSQLNVVLYRNSAGEPTPQLYTVPQATFTPSNNTTTYIVADYNAGTPIYRMTTNVAIINETSTVPVLTIYREGTLLHVTTWNTLGLAKVDKIHQSIVETQRYRRASGLVISEVGTRNLLLSAGVVWVGGVKLSISDIDSRVDSLSFYYHSAGAWTKLSTQQYNNTQYDNGTNLATLTVNRYAVNWVFRGIESNKHLYFVLGNGDYTLAQAQSATIPTLPEAITSHAMLVGKIIIQNGATTATSVQSAFEVQFSYATPTSHNDLLNIQGGNSTERFHITSAQATVVSNTSGTNTGDETKSSIESKLIGDISSHTHSSYVTVATDQTITGKKTFSKAIVPSEVVETPLKNRRVAVLRDTSGNLKLAEQYERYNGSAWEADVEFSVMVGNNAGVNNIGKSCTFYGSESGNNNLGDLCFGAGYASLADNVAERCTAIGRACGQVNCSSYLTAIGHGTGTWNVGANNTMLGSYAGYPDGDFTKILNMSALKVVPSSNVDVGLNRMTISSHGFGANGSYVNIYYMSTTGSAIGGLTIFKAYQVKIIDANTIEFGRRLAVITSQGTGNHNFYPFVNYNNVTCVGANSYPTATNQVSLGNDDVTSVKLGNFGSISKVVGVDAININKKVQLSGSLKVSDDSAVAGATNVGTLRYRTSGNNSYVDMCMQTGASSYAWVNIITNSW